MRKRKDIWKEIFNDPRIRGPLEQEQAQRIDAEPGYAAPTDIFTTTPITSASATTKDQGSQTDGPSM